MKSCWMVKCMPSGIKLAIPKRITSDVIWSRQWSFCIHFSPQNVCINLLIVHCVVNHLESYQQYCASNQFQQGSTLRQDNESICTSHFEKTFLFTGTVTRIGITGIEEIRSCTPRYRFLQFSTKNLQFINKRDHFLIQSAVYSPAYSPGY